MAENKNEAKNKELNVPVPENDLEQKVNMNNLEDSNTFTSGILNLQRTTTLNRLTKYEKARILGTRASQIQNGMSPVFLEKGKHVSLPDEFKDVVKSSIDMAKLELKLKSSPIIIRRKLPSGKIKEKTTQELE